MWDKCLYCGVMYEEEPDTKKKYQIKLHQVHGDLWACDKCLLKYDLTSEGINLIMLDDMQTY
jgi:hypothetical protein